MGWKTTAGGVLASATLVLGVASQDVKNTTPRGKTKTSSEAPSTPPPLAVTLAGNSVTVTPLDRLTTRSGTWSIDDLGAISDGHAYLWRLSTAPDFVRVVVCRRIFTKEEGAAKALSMVSLPVSVNLSGKTSEWTLSVPQGGCRVVQNMEPVAPRADWIRQAIAEGVIPVYRRERAWFPATLTLLAADPARGAYDPTSLGPQPGSLNPPSSGGNYVGVTSAQGGEYDASRGFFHEIDARVVDAAIHNESDRIVAAWPQFTAYTFYSLAQPHGAAWSMVNHTTIDPQFPAAGDRPWETPSIAPRPDIDTMQDVDQWGRDVAHLENTGFIHWLATEDPIAGLVVQRQAAYALASQHENYRANLTTYRAHDVLQERAIFNILSALWKSRDVARRVASSSGTTIWSLTHTQRQMDEIIADLDTIYQKKQASTSAGDTVYGSGDYLDKVTGSVFNNTFVRNWPMKDGTTQAITFSSNFMSGQYGGVPMWLYAKEGNATVRRWLAAYAQQMVARFLYVGGNLAVDGTGDQTSFMPIGPARKNSFGYDVPAAPPFSDFKSWANWWVTQPWAAPGPRDSFNGSFVHTAIQMEAILLFAKDLNIEVADLDAALAKVTETRARTTSMRQIQWMKHMQAPN